MTVLAGSVTTACGGPVALPACTVGVDCIYGYKCNNSGNVYYNQSNNNVVGYNEPYFDVCAVIDPNDSDWEDQVKEVCTDRCFYLDNDLVDNAMYPEVCLDANWSSVEEKINQASGSNLRCAHKSATLTLGPIGSFLGLLAQSYAETLPCDLGDSCLDYLSQEAKRGFTHPDMASIEATADVQMVNDPGFPSSVTLAGTTTTVTGAAAYSATSCGEDACPFYLAQLELEPTSSMHLSIVYQSTTLRKTLSSASASLAHTTMGMWLPSTGDVIFPPGSLHLRIAGVVSGTPEPFGENGNYDMVYTIPTFVFGTLGGGVLSIAHSDQDLLGDWSFEVEFI